MSKRCDDADCDCNSAYAESAWATHVDNPQECPDGCPWCEAEAQELMEAK